MASPRLPEGFTGFPAEPDRVEVATLFRNISKLRMEVDDEEWQKTVVFVSNHEYRNIWNKQVLYLAVAFIVQFIIEYCRDRMPRETQSKHVMELKHPLFGDKVFSMYFKHRQDTIVSSADKFFEKLEEGCGWARRRLVLKEKGARRASMLALTEAVDLELADPELDDGDSLAEVVAPDEADATEWLPKPMKPVNITGDRLTVVHLDRGEVSDALKGTDFEGTLTDDVWSLTVAFIRDAPYQRLSWDIRDQIHTLSMFFVLKKLRNRQDAKLDGAGFQYVLKAFKNKLEKDIAEMVIEGV
jgi:hypothetical protein